MAPTLLQPPSVGFNQVSIVVLTNNNSGVRCWGENLLDQRSRQATSWPSFGRRSSRRGVSPLLLNQEKTESLSPSLLLPVQLYHISGSSLLLMANSCQIVAGFAPNLRLIFINTVLEFHSGIKYFITDRSFFCTHSSFYYVLALIILSSLPLQRRESPRLFRIVPTSAIILKTSQGRCLRESWKHVDFS